MSAPQENETPGAVGAAGRASQNKHLENLDSATSRSEAITTAQAQAARLGCQLFELAGGSFLLTRWGMSKALPDLHAVRALLQRMGAGS